LYDELRPGAPRTVTDDHVERVIIRTLESNPLTRRVAAKPLQYEILTAETA